MDTLKEERWIADRDEPKRFDVPFLVARMPEGQEPVADEAEQFEPVWIRPAEALARHEAHAFSMIFPTVRTLQCVEPLAGLVCSVVLINCATRSSSIVRGLPGRTSSYSPAKRRSMNRVRQSGTSGASRSTRRTRTPLTISSAVKATARASARLCSVP